MRSGDQTETENDRLADRDAMERGVARWRRSFKELSRARYREWVRAKVDAAACAAVEGRSKAVRPGGSRWT